jgi:hypothetical protein
MSFIRQILGVLKSPRASFKSILEKPRLSKANSVNPYDSHFLQLGRIIIYIGKFPLTIPLQQQGERPFTGALVNIEQTSPKL